MPVEDVIVFTIGLTTSPAIIIILFYRVLARDDRPRVTIARIKFQLFLSPPI